VHIRNVQISALPALKDHKQRSRADACDDVARTANKELSRSGVAIEAQSFSVERNGIAEGAVVCTEWLMREDGRWGSWRCQKGDLLHLQCDIQRYLVTTRPRAMRYAVEVIGEDTAPASDLESS
jgi:hypothetical protein